MSRAFKRQLVPRRILDDDKHPIVLLLPEAGFQARGEGTR
jgi:hypothetical protein